MRKVIEVSALMLICVALSSCSGNKPEKAFMGTWKGNHDGEAIELSLMAKDICIAKSDGQAIAGTWSVDPEDEAIIIFQDDSEPIKVVAKLLNDGKMAAQREDESEVVVFEKSDSKKTGKRSGKTFMGTWEGTHEGEPIMLSFMENGMWIVDLPDEKNGGQWTVDPEGNARMTYDDGMAIASPMSGGRIIVKPEDEADAVVFERSGSKK